MALCEGQKQGTDRAPMAVPLSMVTGRCPGLQVGTVRSGKCIALCTSVPTTAERNLCLHRPLPVSSTPDLTTPIGIIFEYPEVNESLESLIEVILLTKIYHFEYNDRGFPRRSSVHPWKVIWSPRSKFPSHLNVTACLSNTHANPYCSPSVKSS